MVNVQIETHPYVKDQGQILIDGKVWKELKGRHLKKFPLQGEFLSFATWQALFIEWEIKQIRAFCLKKLSLKRFFSEEFIQLLEREGFSLASSQFVVQELSPYLDDEDGVESLARRAIRQGKGPLWIKHQLRLKGVKILSLEEYYPENKQKEVIYSLLLKNKSFKSIINRGFYAETVMSCANEI